MFRFKRKLCTLWQHCVLFVIILVVVAGSGKQCNGKKMTQTSTPESSDTSETDTGRNQHTDQLEWIFRTFVESIKTPWVSVKKFATYLMVDLDGYNAFDAIAQWLIRNPFLSLLLFFCFLLSLPFLVIIGLGAIIAAITFTGFIVLEGTMLTFVSMLSFGCLAALVFVLTSIAAVFVAVYMGFAHIYDLYGIGKGTAIVNFLNRENAKRQSTKTAVNQTNSNIDNIGEPPLIQSENQSYQQTTANH